MAKIIDGRALAREMRAAIKEEAERFLDETGVRPGLATVLVGDDPASHQYVLMKGRAADTASFFSRQITLAGDTPHEELLGLVQGLNADPEIHGILVQLPLPARIDEEAILDAIAPEKDVDGFHPVNVGRLAVGDPDVLAPCTPAGIVEMLVRNGHDPRGKHVVVVGRSNIVGKPLALLLLRKGRGGDATVTVAHSRTSDLGAITREADIVVAAVGRPNTITRDMVKDGVVVIDVGSNRVDDPDAEQGYRWVGDVDFEGVSEVAAAISPVPGGVGPMTITMLLKNTLEAARRQVARSGVAERAGAS
ncbi:MAG TPA: bifunctional methylenetetrahydrofolate dehydrogenase/methenyltetrahydrofolate cyclohydrolase FolD [Longimicrobiales bacterium]|nr:bifunctional methylenetetrahydrofolate dehydrogenase/methenyltetrahydrofolate cyclohydrolase FolD [Longimicrobiales bacterium]